MTLTSAWRIAPLRTISRAAALAAALVAKYRKPSRARPDFSAVWAAFVTPFMTLLLALPPNGVTLSDTLPDDPALHFFELFLQVIEADPFASKGLSFTPGLKLHLGFDLP